MSGGLGVRGMSGGLGVRGMSGGLGVRVTCSCGSICLNSDCISFH